MTPLHLVMETSLYVSDVARAIVFYRDVLGLRLMEEFEADRGAAFQVGPTVLLLFRADVTRRGGGLPPHGTTGQGHIAFRVEPGELDSWRSHLRQRGVPIEQEVVFAGNPPSLYFRDPDGNLLELAVASIWAFE